MSKKKIVRDREPMKSNEASAQQPTTTNPPLVRLPVSEDEHSEYSGEEASDEMYYKFDDPAPLSPPRQIPESRKRKAPKKPCPEKNSVENDMANFREVQEQTKPFIYKRGGREGSWQEDEQLGKFGEMFKYISYQ